MSDTRNNETAGKAPSHIAYKVIDRDGRKSFWTRIGVAYEHKDNCGYNVQLSCIPLDGRIVIRTATEKKE